MREFAGRLISAQEFERARIARELHDDFSQKLALLTFELKDLRKLVPDEAGVRETVQRLEQNVQSMMRDLHDMIQQLHPSRLSLGLVIALNGLVSEVRQRYPIDVQFRHDGDDSGLSNEITLCLFRVAQESLNNVVKHSSATHASVILETTDDLVRLSVVDDGRGFERSRTSDGLGLISMAERVETAGGHLTIRSQASRGTKVQAAIRRRVSSPEAARPPINVETRDSED